MDELNTSVEEFVLRDDSSSRLEILFKTTELASIGPNAKWPEKTVKEICSPKLEKVPTKSKYYDIYAEDLSIYDEIKEKNISVSIEKFFAPLKISQVCSAC